MGFEYLAFAALTLCALLLWRLWRSPGVAGLESQLSEVRAQVATMGAEREQLRRREQELLEEFFQQTLEMRKMRNENLLLRARVSDLERKLGITRRVPLRILGIWPAVSGEQSLAQRAEADALYESGVAYAGLFDQVTKLSILEELGRDNYNVLEIGAHGMELELDGQQLNGGIMLADGMAPPGWWGRLVRNRGIELVVLLACESDDVGDALLREGVRAVVTATREIRDDASVNFALMFYRYVAQGWSLSRAVETAKLALDPRQAEMIRWRGEDLWSDVALG